MLLDLPQPGLLLQLQVLLRHEAALARHGVNVSIPLQLLVGPLGGDHADPQVPGQGPDGGQGLPGLQPPRGHGALDLPADLLVDGLAAGVADDDVHGFTSVFLYMYSIYSNYSLSRGNRKIPREILGRP